MTDKTKSAGAPRVLGQGRYLTLVDEGGWEYTTRHGVTGVVVIVAITDEGKLLLVEQHRQAVHRRVIELPAGLVGDEQGRGAAYRRMVDATKLIALAAGPIAVGVSDELVTFFEARGLRGVGPGGGDDSEEITVHEVPLAGLRAFLAAKEESGLAVDPKIFSGLFLVGVEVPR